MSFRSSLFHRPLDCSLVSYYAVDSLSGKVLMEMNSNISMVPASCMKLVTTAAALNLLGTNLRFETHLQYDGSIINENTLKGNIYIQGNGDPCLGSDRIAGNPSWKKQVELWGDAIEQLGIRIIKGKIIPDNSKWEKNMAVPSWCYEDLANYYGAGASALSFNENQYSIFLSPERQLDNSHKYCEQSH